METKMTTYKKTKQACIPLGSTDLSAIMNLAIESCNRKKGKVTIYPETQEGLTAFWESSKGYLAYVAQYNETDPEVKLYPDIESWAMFLGITRKTIFLYEKERSEEWADAIGYIKGCIGAAKKQLVMTGRIPPIIGIFDLVNNHQYLNTNSVRIESDNNRRDKQQTNADLLKSIQGAIIETDTETDTAEDDEDNGLLTVLESDREDEE